MSIKVNIDLVGNKNRFLLLFQRDQLHDRTESVAVQQGHQQGYEGICHPKNGLTKINRQLIPTTEKRQFRL